MNARKTGPVASEMLARLEAALSPTLVELMDDSESHFSLRVESPAFAGKSRVDRYRLVHAALGDLLDERVHALSIKAIAPGEGQ